MLVEVPKYGQISVGPKMAAGATGTVFVKGNTLAALVELIQAFLEATAIEPEVKEPSN